MAQADGILITSRRNFLVRALGFTAVAAPIPLLAAPAAPIITPELVRQIEEWRVAHLAYDKAMNICIEKERRSQGNSEFAAVERAIYEDAQEHSWKALRTMQRTILGLPQDQF